MPATPQNHRKTYFLDRLLGISTDFGESLEPALESRVLAELHLGLVLPAKHPLARKRSAQANLLALREEVFLQPAAEEKPAYLGHLDEAWARTMPTPRIVRAVDGPQNVLAMVAAGYGVTVLSGHPATVPIPGCRVKRLCLPPPSYQLRMLWRKEGAPLVLHHFLQLTEHLNLPESDLLAPVTRATFPATPDICRMDPAAGAGRSVGS